MTELATPFKWCQRKEHIYLTVEVRDIKEEKIDLQPTYIKFECTSDKKTYKGELHFYEEIDVENSKFTVLGLHGRYLLAKKNVEADYWPRLTKEKLKLQNLTIDWDRYIDEDEEGEENKMDWDQDQMQGMGGMPGGPGGMGGMPGMGGMGGMPGMGGMGGGPGGMGGMPGMGGMGGGPGGMGGMDMAKLMEQMQAGGMGGMGGMPGMGGMGGAEGDSDDDEQDPNQDLDKEEEVVEGEKQE